MNSIRYYIPYSKNNLNTFPIFGCLLQFHHDYGFCHWTFQLGHECHTFSWSLSTVRKCELMSRNMSSLDGKGKGNLRSIQAPDSIFSIPGVFKFNESKTRRVPGYPNIAQRSILGESRLQLMFGGTAPQISHIDFAGKVPISVRHGLILWKSSSDTHKIIEKTQLGQRSRHIKTTITSAPALLNYLKKYLRCQVFTVKRV